MFYALLHVDMRMTVRMRAVKCANMLIFRLMLRGAMCDHKKRMILCRRELILGITPVLSDLELGWLLGVNLCLIVTKNVLTLTEMFLGVKTKISSFGRIPNITSFRRGPRDVGTREVRPRRCCE